MIKELRNRAGWILAALTVATAILALSALGGRAAAEPQPDATALNSPGVNLLPVWDSGGTWGASTYTQIKSKGFGLVRFNLHWSDFEPTQGQWNQTNISTLDTAISRAKAAGLKIVLVDVFNGGSAGMKYYPAWAVAQGGDSVTVVQRSAGPYVRMLAGRYDAEPAVVAEELVSDPFRWPLDQNGVLRMYQTLITEARSVSRDKLLIFEPTFGDTAMTGADAGIITDKHQLVFSLHDYYAGGCADGYNADGSQRQSCYTFAGTGYDPANAGDMEAHLQVALDWLRPQDVPLYIGEFGIPSGASGHDQFIRDSVSTFHKFECDAHVVGGVPPIVGYTWWEFKDSGTYSAVDPANTATWKPWADALVGSACVAAPSQPPVSAPPTPSTQPPTAAASVTPTSGTAPLTVRFTGSGSDPNGGSITSWAWAFGDGQTSNAQSPRHTYTAAGSYSAKLTVTDDEGQTAAATANLSVAAEPQPAPAAGDPVIMAVGDTTSSASNGNDLAVRDVVKSQGPANLLFLGDYQYTYGSLPAILGGADKIWGPKPGGLWPLIRPTAGPTHDVSSCGDTNYQSYWGRSAMQGYSFDVGTWHIIQLPSAAYRYGCDTAGILAWLKADLAAHPSRCTLAFWHEPYWTRPTSEHGRTTAVKPWVQALYGAGADVILNGHQHDYQRFAPQNPSDQADAGRGLREFIVGTGGIGLYGFTGSAPNVDASSDTTYGALKLTLHDGSYDWQFVRAAGGSFSDAGSGTCH